MQEGKFTGIKTKVKVFLDRGKIIVSADDNSNTKTSVHAHIYWMDKKPVKKGEVLMFKC